MKNVFMLAMLISTLAFTSCKQENPSPYQGNYAGTFSGDDSGIWSGTIDENGMLNGTGISSTVPGIPFELKGSVSDQGELAASLNIPLFGAISFTGHVVDNKVEGTWLNSTSALQGTFEGQKN